LHLILEFKNFLQNFYKNLPFSCFKILIKNKIASMAKEIEKYKDSLCTSIQHSLKPSNPYNDIEIHQLQGSSIQDISNVPED
jgi:hypothetical protein